MKRCKLFSLEKIVFRSHTRTSEKATETFGPGTHAFLFGLKVPLLTSCCSARRKNFNHGLSSLPPSFELVTGTLKASAKYRLRAVVERPGLLRRKLSVVRSVEFRPLQPPRSHLTEEQQPLRITGRIDGAVLGVEEKMSGDETELPPYNPSVQLEVILSNAGTISPGVRVDLSISISIPSEVHQCLGSVWLEYLMIRLKTTTTGAVPYQQRSHISYVSLCNIQGLLPLAPPNGNERYMLPSQLWQNHICPLMLPSFQTCGLQRAHRLEVHVGIVSGMTSKVNVRQL